VSSGPTIETQALAKSYSDVAALRGVDLRVDTGTVFGLLGPNGAGKTTAVRILTTLLRPDSGGGAAARRPCRARSCRRCGCRRS
jgi:ABC-2 type transport system ATP-binding protein